MYKIDACPFCGQSYQVKQVSPPLVDKNEAAEEIQGQLTLERQREVAPDVAWTAQDFLKNRLNGDSR